MSGLFTVKMVRFVDRTTFNMDGSVLARTREALELSYHDLPAMTAQGYRDRFPDNQVTIELQHESFGDKARASFSYQGASKGTLSPPSRPNYAPKAPSAGDGGTVLKPRATETITAAETGDMAAAITEAVE